MSKEHAEREGEKRDKETQRERESFARLLHVSCHFSIISDQTNCIQSYTAKKKKKKKKKCK